MEVLAHPEFLSHLDKRLERQLRGAVASAAGPSGSSANTGVGTGMPQPQAQPHHQHLKGEQQLVDALVRFVVSIETVDNVLVHLCAIASLHASHVAASASAAAAAVATATTTAPAAHGSGAGARLSSATGATGGAPSPGHGAGHSRSASTGAVRRVVSPLPPPPRGFGAVATTPSMSTLVSVLCHVGALSQSMWHRWFDVDRVEALIALPKFMGGITRQRPPTECSERVGGGIGVGGGMGVSGDLGVGIGVVVGGRDVASRSNTPMSDGGHVPISSAASTPLLAPLPPLPAAVVPVRRLFYSGNEHAQLPAFGPLVADTVAHQDFLTVSCA